MKVAGFFLLLLLHDERSTSVAAALGNGGKDSNESVGGNQQKRQLLDNEDIRNKSDAKSGGLGCDVSFFDDLPSNYRNRTFGMESYEIPTEATTYVVYTPALEMEEDEYIVRFTPIVENPDLVHHMILYECTKKPKKKYSTPSTRPIPPECIKTWILNWGTGGEDVCLPQGTGMKLRASKPWYLFQIHYNNNQALAGIKDSSKLQITTVPFSEALNYQLAGTFVAGINFDYIKIPPGHSAYELSGVCSNPNLPSSGVKVLNYGLHAHGRATKLWTQVKRADMSGKFDIGCELQYDFHRQIYEPLPEPQTIYPGDEVTVHCIYDTSNETEVIQGGTGSEREMCIGFFLYYPLQEDMRCISRDVTGSVGDDKMTCNWPFEWPESEQGNIISEQDDLTSDNVIIQTHTHWDTATSTNIPTVMFMLTGFSCGCILLAAFRKRIRGANRDGTAMSPSNNCSGFKDDPSDSSSFKDEPSNSTVEMDDDSSDDEEHAKLMQ